MTVGIGVKNLPAYSTLVAIKVLIYGRLNFDPSHSGGLTAKGTHVVSVW